MADVITNSGRAALAGFWANTVAIPATLYGNVGTGTGAGIPAAVGDTTLATEVGTARIATTRTRVTTTVTNDTAQTTFTYTATGSVTVTNAGYFDATTAGTLYQKSDFTGIPLQNTDSIAFTFKNQIV